MSLNKLIITPNRSGISISEIIRYKDLFFNLASKDFKVKYAQTALGAIWALLQPIVNLVIFTLVFDKAVQIDTDNVPYVVFAMSGISAWTYFSYVFNNSGSSLVASQSMITKVYFPRIIIPLSKSLVGLVELGITLLLLCLVMIYYQYFPGYNIIYFPIVLISLIISSLGVGIWVSALTIRFRDLHIAIPFIIQVGTYITPVAYPANLIPEKYKVLYYLNPMSGVIELYRWSALGYEELSIYVGISLVVGIILFVSSLFYFSKVEQSIADTI